jgi:predicted metalloprotease with PDZ domain
MQYNLSFEHPHQHLVRVNLSLSPAEQSQTLLLSSWRPGRYELAPYAENICDFEAKTASGKPLTITKTAYNAWQIAPSANEAILVSYKYLAIDRSAGASNFDSTQIYLNPINLLVYVEGTINEPCEVQLHLPSDYQLACGMRREGNTLFAKDFHELADCPLFAAADMQCLTVNKNGIDFHLWFLGQVRPDEVQVKSDFSKFISAQIKLFGAAPFDVYHFLFQMRDDAFYHGVEHQNSTVIALGPAIMLMHPDLYEEFLGVSSHELFHAWNVKAIRPVDMQPYRYGGQNYSRLHYVTEGVTTYYGDLMLLKSGVWDLQHFLKVFNNSAVKRAFNTDGWKHISLEEASFDSWVNGYKDAIPNRKISFYNKGALVAFLLDWRIREATSNARSLDHIMVQMWEQFGKTGKGYTRQDYQSIAESVSGLNLNDFFAQFISGTVPLFAELEKAANYFGLFFISMPYASHSLRLFGFSFETSTEVKQIFEGSPAEIAGLEKGDRIVAVNGRETTNSNLELVLGFFANENEVTFSLFRQSRLHQVVLKQTADWIGVNYGFAENAAATPAQLQNRKSWMELQPVGVIS